MIHSLFIVNNTGYESINHLKKNNKKKINFISNFYYLKRHFYGKTLQKCHPS